jgi:hypothetical protein
MATDATGGTSTDMPGRITFWTTPDNSGTLQERMRIANNGNVGIGTSSPNSSAILHVSSTNKGVMLPKVSLSGATDNTTVPVSSPGDDGMFLYNTANAGTGTNAITPGYYYWQNNRWNKLQTNAYAGVIFGVHNSTVPNHLTATSPSWQYTGSYIDLPPGKWVVYILELIHPSNSGTSGWDGSGDNRALWIRTSLSNSNTVFSYSSHIIGSTLASGSIVAPSKYGMVNGAIYVYNNTGTTTRYYLWANVERFNTSCDAHNFAANAWAENQFFAVPAE